MIIIKYSIKHTVVATFKVLAPNKYKAKQHLNALEQ